MASVSEIIHEIGEAIDLLFKESSACEPENASLKREVLSTENSSYFERINRTLKQNTPNTKIKRKRGW